MDTSAIISGMVHGVGLLVLIAVVRSVRALVRGRLTSARRPLIIYRLILQTVMLAIYSNYLLERVWRVTGLPRGLTSFGTIMVFLLIGFDWYAASRVDDSEYEQQLRHAAAQMAEQAIGADE